MSQGFHEEEVLGKAFDLPLVRRLLRYAKPYWLYVVVCVVLTLLMTAASLALPLIYRKAVNDCIVTTYKSIDLSALSEATKRRLLKAAGDRLLVADEKTRLISTTDFKSLDPEISVRLIKEGAVREPYYIVRPDDFPEPKQKRVMDIINAPPRRFKKGEGFYYIAYKDVVERKVLSESELKVLRENDLGRLKILLLLFVLLLALNFFLTFGQYHLSQYIGQRIIMDIRMELFEHIESLSLRFFDSNPVGRLVTRVTNDIEVLNTAFVNIMINLFKDIFLLAGIVIMLLLLNFELALITFCILPVLIWVTFVFRKKVREAFREVRVRIARINATIAEHISGMSVVQLFNREEAAYKQFEELNEKNYLANLRQIFVFAVFRPAIDMFSSLGIALLLWYGGGEVIQGSINLGDLWAFFFYLRMFFRPINELSQKYNQLQQAMASSERVFLLLDTEDRIPEPEEPVRLDDVRGEIEFRGVSFAYKDEPVLKDVSFKVRPGEKVALVGPTGAGKSSIINLLSRFYDVQEGAILIDGVDIRKVRKSDLRSKIAVVMQDTFVFSGDVKSNIRLNSFSITDDAIVSAARYAKADAFIQRLPNGYDHYLHERGATISQGERQLLSFARAIAFDPKIFVLDEATANIDTETETLIQEAIENLMRNRTSIVIAHRLSTIRNADRILVIDDGRIVEEGTHQELLERGGLYHKLYQLQFKDT